MDGWLIVGIVLAVIVLLLILVKIYNYATCGRYKGKEKLEGKVAIVTGSNSGIGLETAKDFAKRGAKIIMVCRDMAKAERAKAAIVTETKNSNISLKNIDFTSLESVRRCANEILNEEPKIDILVNNAGAYNTGLGLTEDGLEILMQANHFGPFLFTNKLLGRIKQSAPSRIVNVASTGYKYGDIDLNHVKKTNRTIDTLLYCDTKLANVYFSNELARKLMGTGVTSNSLHPGVIATDILRNLNGCFNVVWFYLSKFFFKTAKDGAQTQIFLSVSPKVERVTGCYYSDCKIERLTPKASDMKMAKLLWDLSEEAVHLQPEENHYE